jgi:uncharacterized protein (TIGR00730 family)
MNHTTDPRIAAILASPSYRLAEEDATFLENEAARASRLALEFLRADFYLREHRINSTVVVFGGSRIRPTDVVTSELQRAEQPAAQSRDPGRGDPVVDQLRRELTWSRFYEEARSLAKTLAEGSRSEQGHEFVVVTGGGPGIMEGANRGAAEAGAPTIGFNIRLPQEQSPNPYITPTLAFRFHYFALRKMHFLLRARALVAFPGGYGTLDELFESLNLVQTQKIRPIPIVLVGKEHWRNVVNFDYLLAQGFIGPRDLDILRVVETGDEAARLILDYYASRHADPSR